MQRLANTFDAQQLSRLLEGMAQPHHVSFRINTLKANTTMVLEQLADLHIPIHPNPVIPSSYHVDSCHRQTLTHSGAAEGKLLYIQNLSSLLPVHILQPQAGQRILDLCAAPGSKTTQLAALMNNQGSISAVEKVKSRYYRLKNNLAEYGVTNTRCYLMDGAAAGNKVPQQFDKVLLDAPCSSEGQFVLSDAQSYAYWTARKSREMQKKQRRLMQSALKCLKPGGDMIYSTCTLSVLENEDIIHWTLDRYGSALEIVPIDLALDNVMGGITQHLKRHHDQIQRCLRIIPDRLCEGFFLCHLRKLNAIE